MLIKSPANVPSTLYDPFCKCRSGNYSWHAKGEMTDSEVNCTCGEENANFEWIWDDQKLTSSTVLSANKRDVFFHQTFSSGTAAVRGNVAFEQNRHYYWEIKMLSALYGTDVMVGFGTESVKMNMWPYRFCSMLGLNDESWGYSYRGHVQHGGARTAYGPKFGQGTIIGVHLDMCNGTVQFYHNRRPLGVAFRGLKKYQKLYPMVCSTAAQSAMRMTCALSVVPSLQFLTIQKLVADNLVGAIDIVPGLRNMLSRQFWWLLRAERDSSRNSAANNLKVIRNGDTEEDVCTVSSSTSSASCDIVNKSSKRKRKREPPPKASSAVSAAEVIAHLTDGPSSSRDLLPQVSQTDSSDAIFATCDSCGIARAVGSKRSNRINKSRLCVYCDGII